MKSNENKTNSKPKGKGKGKGNKGKKPGKEESNAPFKGQSIKKEDDVRDSVSKGQDNDPSWYGVSPQMVNDTARISFNNPAGLPLRVWSQTDGFTTEATAFNTKAIPGIMRLNYAYGPGMSIDRSSALNLASTNLYAFVRHVNSGAANYETADLMMYLLGVSSCYVYYVELLRLYGFTLSYKQSNRYFNEALIMSFGFNPKEIEKHLPQLRFAINKFARKLGTKPIPDNLNIFKRMTFLPSQVFSDANVKKAQFYVFKPWGYYTYEEVEAPHGTYLKWNTVRDLYDRAGVPEDKYGTVEAIEAVTEFMCNKLLDSEDVGIISGDIMKAYGDNVYQIREIDETYRQEVFFSEEILDQIHNATIMGDLSNLDITQTYDQNLGSTVIWAPTLDAYPGPQEEDKLKLAYQSKMDGNMAIDLPYDDPTPDDVMVATRLSCRATSGANPLMMTECIMSADIVTLNNGRPQFYGPIHGITDVSNSSPITSGFALQIADKWTKFDRGPATILFYSGAGLLYEATLYDYYNYTYIGAAELSKMHETAVLSLWDVPETAFYSSI